MDIDLTRYRIKATIYPNGMVMLDDEYSNAVKILIADFGDDWIAVRVPGHTYWCNADAVLKYGTAKIIVIHSCKMVTSPITPEDCEAMNKFVSAAHDETPFTKKVTVYENVNVDGICPTRYGFKADDAAKTATRLLAASGSD